MTHDELKQRAAERHARLLSRETSDVDANACLTETGRDVSLLFGLPLGPKSAVVPNPWIALIEILLPILLAWIDRRFPKPPAPVVTPVPVTADP